MNAPYHTKALPPGTILREWRLEQVLGVGGFGIVYRARGIYFDELVAIKEYFPSAISDRRDGDTVVPNDSSSEEIHALGLKKFVEEAKLLWNLSKPTRHPNIVSVRSLFEIHGTAYMVMDFESGVSLSQMLRDGQRFDEASLLALVKPIAEGLERAHRVGVLHRDIKPANILVSEDGRPVLIDFGSARFDSGQATNTKVTFHTPPYAAIEQYVKTYTQGPWTDIYALGVAIAECITGEKPPEVLERLHGGLGEPLVAREWPGFSRPFLRAIDAAMIIRPEGRPQSISQWLTMFDAEDVDEVASSPSNDYQDEPTRIAVLQDLVEPTLSKIQQDSPSAIVVAMPGEPPHPVDADPPEVADRPEAVDPPEAAPATPVWRSRSVLTALFVVAAMVIGIIVLQGRGRKIVSPDLLPAITAAPAAADPATSASVAGLETLPAETAALLADARRTGRPRSEIAQLKLGSDRLGTMLGELKTLASDPNAADQAKAKLAELNQVAIDLAKRESATLSNAAKLRIRALKQDLPWADSVNTSTAKSNDERTVARSLRAAKAGLDAASASASTATDARAAIAATRAAVTAYGQFDAAAGKADGYVLPAKRNAFAQIEAGARELHYAVVEAAKGNRPGLFASRARRDAWRLRQDNATRAAALNAELDQLAAGVRGTSLITQIDQAISRATVIKHDLLLLRDASAVASRVED